MEVAHADLAKVTGMVLVKVDAVVVLPTGVTAARGMLAVLANTAVAGGHVAALFAVLREAGRLQRYKRREKNQKKQTKKTKKTKKKTRKNHQIKINTKNHQNHQKSNKKSIKNTETIIEKEA
jgi:uncharacterized membrane protein YhiD involved in acid resistance